MSNTEVMTVNGLNLTDRFIIKVIGSYYFGREFNWASIDICWEDVVEKAFRHGVVPILYFAVKDNPQLGAPEWVVDQLRSTFLAHFYKHITYEAEIEKLLAHLEDKGIEVIILKGFVLSRLIYPDPVQRTFVDVDLLFKEKDWGSIRAFLLEAGFELTRDDLGEVLPPKIIPGDNFDHTLIFYNTSQLKLELKLDPFDLGIRSRMLEDIWEKSVVHDFGSFKCRSLAPEHQLLHLLIHLNHHGFRKIKWFIDIALILKNEHKLDWELIAHSAKRDNIHAPAYFSLVHVCRLFDIELNEKILEQLRPGYIKSMVWRSVWPEKDIANLSGIEYGPLLFRKKFFSKWFIPNILLTGKAVQKTSYFLRRVFPPSDFMESKYSNGAKRSYVYYMAKRYRSLLNTSARGRSRSKESI